MSLFPFTSDDELLSVAVKIRESSDLSTVINEGFGLRRELPTQDLDIAENAEALIQMMFSDELWMLEQAIRKAADEPGLSPLVQYWLVTAQFWARHEENRRFDARYQALVDSFSGHLLHLIYEFGLDPPMWSWICECNDEDAEEVLYADRSTADAAMRLHMALYGLPESAIFHVGEEQS